MKKSSEIFKNSVIVCAIGMIVAGGIVIYKLRKRVQELIVENANEYKEKQTDYEEPQEEKQEEIVEKQEKTDDKPELCEKKQEEIEKRQKEYEEKQEEYKRAAADMRKKINELEVQMSHLKALNAQAGMAINNAIAQEHLTKEFAEKINRIIVTLENIASQTKLLSLNASIEAARIEEEGREFTEVAEKIRMLAGNSVNSAVEIEELLRELIYDLEENIVKLQKLNETLEFDKQH